MKSKIIMIFGILLLIGFRDIYCQSNNPISVYNTTNYEPLLTGELFSSASNVELSTYFNAVWLKGDIYLSNGEIGTNKLIKYNGFLDELLWLEPKSKTIVKLDKESINLFHFQNFNGDTSIYFQKIKIKRNGVTDSAEIFAEVIYKGKVSLYVIHSFVIDRKELVETNAGIGEKVIYAKEPIYVFKTGNNKSFVIKNLNRNNLYTLSPDHKEQIKQYCKTNEIGEFPGKAELIGLGKFLGAIVEF